MRRRESIAGRGGAGAWPALARAQSQLVPIGFLDSQSPLATVERLLVVHRGLAETGYTEGRNVAIEYRWAENQSDRPPACKI
jgi:putative tryptophan/tyrosine transport system substrate-binding protein